MPSHHHRSGGLKQSNKRNKRSNASKRSLSRNAGGKVVGGGRSGPVKSSRSNAIQSSKANRRHQIQQKRQASRQALLDKKRGVVGSASTFCLPPPRLVGIVSLGATTKIEQTVQSFLLKGADKVIPHGGDNNKTATTAKYSAHKKGGNLTYLTTANSKVDHEHNDAILAALDLCRICHIVLFVIDGNGPNENEEGESAVLGMQIGNDTKSTSSTTTSATTRNNWDHLISERGDSILTAIKAQGLATPVTVLAHTVKDDDDDDMPEDYMTMQSTKSVRRSALKRRLDLKRFVSRFATTEFGQDHDKVMEINLTEEEEDNEEDMDDDGTAITTPVNRQSSSRFLVRTLCNMAASPPKWVADAPRAYLVSHDTAYNAEQQELQLTGFVRGCLPWNVNSLVHVPHMGTFACKHVQKATNPLRHDKKKKMKNAMHDSSNPSDEHDVLWSDPSKRESLTMLATPDALEGEQNLIGFDEAMDAVDEEEEEEDLGVARPAGWSDYQSAWLDAVPDDSALALEEELDHGELAKALNQKTKKTMEDNDQDDDDMEVSAEERQALAKQRRRDLKEDLEFPDEVELNEDENARDRYARYRSLKSFRKSFWDPKEDLPDSFGSVYHFSSFKATQRDVMADMRNVQKAAVRANGDFWGGTTSSDATTSSQERHEGMEVDSDMEDDDDDTDNMLDGCIPSGSYVTVTLEKVSPDAYSRISTASLVTAVTLLPHENKVSVMHMGLSQSSKCDQSQVPIKSKDVLTFRCGWRTWKARPVFSQNNLNSDKHKFERFLPQGGAFFAASVFGPVTYNPCPVLVFRESISTKDNAPTRELVAVGSMIGADAERIVVKRIILTGYPVRVHKRHATVKYMFYNPDDVKWFKPAGLTTKHGLHGNIIESVGEHGTMKCLFNAPIKQHDTVCLPLYKRIYPKYAPENDSPGNEGGTVARSGLEVL